MNYHTVKIPCYARYLNVLTWFANQNNGLTLTEFLRKSNIFRQLTSGVEYDIKNRFEKAQKAYADKSFSNLAMGKHDAFAELSLTDDEYQRLVILHYMDCQPEDRFTAVINSLGSIHESYYDNNASKDNPCVRTVEKVALPYG